MIKKTLFWLLISLLSFIGFSSALDYTQIWYYYIWDVWVFYTSNSKNYFIDSLWNFSTNWRNLFYWTTNTYNNQTRNYSYSWLNWNLYFVWPDPFSENLTQYVVDKWCISPVSTRDYNNSVFHSDCTFNKTVEEVKSRVSSFSEYVVSILGSASPNWSFNNDLPLLLCLSDWNFDYCVSCSIQNCPSWSNWLNLNFTDWTFNSLSSYNWSSSFLWGWGSYWNNARNNNNNIYCPTIKQLINKYGQNYNTWLCYNSTLKYENGQIQTVEKKDIFTVFENYQEYSNRLSIYQNQCTNPNTQQNCESAFSWQREKYSIIANIWNWWVDRKNIWNYCNLWLNYDPNATTCVASWYVAEPPTSEDVIDNIRENGLTILNKPWTWNIFNSLLWSWENRENINIYDIIWNFTQIKDKVGSLFKERKWTNGIIPDYILWIIMLTLLLTVLFKK